MESMQKPHLHSSQGCFPFSQCAQLSLCLSCSAYPVQQMERSRRWGEEEEEEEEEGEGKTEGGWEENELYRSLLHQRQHHSHASLRHPTPTRKKELKKNSSSSSSPS
ncbi:Hypothetical predicted protein [Xyrichtys novacula]|uniref:Uncharacterized protein n=1 Tax=Xyrichtys novacula TaxID=13765 RepID=A0AAV1H4J3_XYRNO|nr:Hypothetical predicted protein [Xyrichtys novacula]